MLCYYLLLPWSSNLPFTYSMAYRRTFLLHSTAKTQKSQTQKEESFTRKSPFLKHQEKFSKDSPYDKIFVKHSAQGVQRDWRSPFAVLNLQDSKKINNLFKLHDLSEKILQVFYTCIFRISRCACICMGRLC